MSETEILKKFYMAINQNEVNSFADFFDPQALRLEPAGSGNDTAGVYHGPKDIAEHIKKGRGTWAEGSCEIEDFKIYGERFVAFIYVRVRLKNNSEWLEGRCADGFIFKNDKITHFQTFWEREEATAWGEMDN